MQPSKYKKKRVATHGNGSTSFSCVNYYSATTVSTAGQVSQAATQESHSATQESHTASTTTESASTASVVSAGLLLQAAKDTAAATAKNNTNFFIFFLN